MIEIVIALLTVLTRLVQWGPVVALLVWFGWRSWKFWRGEFFWPGDNL